MLRQIRQLSLVALALAACTKDPAPAPKAEKKADDAPAYELNLAASGPWAAGQASNAAVTVTAKPGFHVNPEYPVTFKPEGSEAVKFEGERVALTPGTRTPCADKAEDACKVEFPLPVTPEKPGPAKVAGIVAFSVCSADKCLIEKVPVTLAISVQ
ncbi:MAG: hypothetical protein Q8N23_18080 [Archangium sp.]|nr:hypothetical protein [Archangium sp.]MDP3154593.1 hypothetical protein [Archangium sp.]MDP3574343.1 hypothetical protein [Archangium sp.]